MEITLEQGDNATRMSGKVDTLRLFFGDPYPINDQITIKQPTLMEIMEYGESEFYSMVYIFIGNTTYRKLFLWENGIDWNKISDYELFINLVRMLPNEMTRVMFGDIDFTGFHLYERDDPAPEPPLEGKVKVVEKNKYAMRIYDRTHTFINEDQGIEISPDTYYFMRSVMREMFKSFPKTEYANGAATRDLLITEEQEKMKRALKEQGEADDSTLLPMISFCVNHPGFKYKTSELKEVGIYEFMDSVQRLQIWESTHALLNGSMSGFCDTSKIPQSQFDFMRTINK